jgi:hypothetical protein
MTPAIVHQSQFPKGILRPSKELQHQDANAAKVADET